MNMKYRASEAIVLLSVILWMFFISFSGKGDSVPDKYLSGDFYFVVNDDGKTATVTGHTENLQGDLVIPESVDINGKIYAVTRIGDTAFIKDTGLSGKLVIPDGVKYIGEAAFMECGLAGDLHLPESLEYLGDLVFYGCEGLTGDLILPKGLREIPDRAFCNCTGLNGRLVIPDSVERIGDMAFFNCSGLNGPLNLHDNISEIGYAAFFQTGFTGELRIPGKIDSIKDFTFYNCRDLTGDLIIPDNVKKVEPYAFTFCSGLNGSLKLPKDITYIGDAAFDSCPFTGELVIPEKVEKIGLFAFNECKFHGDLIIPGSTTIIGEQAFGNCSGFSGDLILPDGIEKIEQNTFLGCSGLDGKLILPNGLVSIGKQSFSTCGFHDRLIIPEGVEDIGDYAFYGCEYLSGDLSFPESVSSIGEYSFSGCNKLESVEIKNLQCIIGTGSFVQCSSLHRIENNSPERIYLNSIGSGSDWISEKTGEKSEYVAEDSVVTDNDRGKTETEESTGADGDFEIEKILDAFRDFCSNETPAKYSRPSAYNLDWTAIQRGGDSDEEEDMEETTSGTYYFNDWFGELIIDHEIKPGAYTYDVDNDGKPELLIEHPAEGYYIYDFRDNGIYELDAPEGTASRCTLFEKDGLVYVGHSDTSHQGRQDFYFTRYDGSGNIVEGTYELRADYPESEEDYLTEKCEYHFNGQSISLEEYIEYTETYLPVDESLLEPLDYVLKPLEQEP